MYILDAFHIPRTVSHIIAFLASLPRMLLSSSVQFIHASAPLARRYLSPQSHYLFSLVFYPVLFSSALIRTHLTIVVYSTQASSID